MNLVETLAQHGYRTVLALEWQPVGVAQVELAATFSSETGPWKFQVPSGAKKPFFVASEQLGQTLVVLEGCALVGRTQPEVIRALKAERPSLRHLVDARKRTA